MSSPAPRCPTPRRSPILAAATLTALCGALLAQTPQLVADIHPTGSAEVQHITRVFDRVFFQADDSVSGKELWVSDGTSAGTRRVVDLDPGAPGSAPRDLVRLGNKLLFAAATPPYGEELWMSDGTDAGTVMLADLLPGILASRPRNLFRFRERVYFSANDGNTGHELWVTDGGTPTLVKDIWPGSPLSTHSEPGHFAAVGNTGTFVFSAHDGVTGRELWVSDGTPGGTTLLMDIRPGVLHSNPGHMVEFGGRVYFQADDGVQGPELWVTDGTPGGTMPVKDIWPGASGSRPSSLTVLRDKILFRATAPGLGGELWVSDGTAAGTVLLRDIWVGSGDSAPDSITAIGSRHVYFAADDGNNGRELWVSDGTAAGTHMATSMVPGRSSFDPNNVTEAQRRSFAVLKGRVYFAANDGNTGSELWSVDHGATATPVGDGCDSPVPTLAATDPVLGGAATISGVGAGRLTVFGLPADFQFTLPPFCAIYLDPSLLVGLNLSTTATWSFPLAIPSQRSLRGLTVSIQALDVGVLTTSNSVELTLGN